MPEGRWYMSMLLDFYGDLLTERQRNCCDLHYNEDLSLSEIAEQCGISRQGVWDTIRHAEDTLRETEEKTGLLRRFSETEEKLAKVLQDLEQLRTMTDGEAGELTERAAAELRTLLQRG